MNSDNRKGWWDGRREDSLFPSVYRQGDDSLEGNLESQLLELDQRTQRECDMVEALLGLHAGSRILDCPCGYGRHSLELARRGHRVTGVDLCPAFVADAREAAEGLPRHAQCRFLLGDMRSLPRGLQGFDVCINMFLSFGYFGDADNSRVLREFHRTLVPGGELLIHADTNPDRIRCGGYQDRPVRTLRSGSQLLIDESYDHITRRLTGTWTVESPSGTRTTRSYSVRIYDHQEMQGLLEAAGFEDVSVVYPDSDKQSGDVPPQEVVYVARRQV